MLNLAFALHASSHLDSKLATTREYWRREAGLPEAIVMDPRPLAEIAADVTAPVDGVDNGEGQP